MNADVATGTVLAAGSGLVLARVYGPAGFARLVKAIDRVSARRVARFVDDAVTAGVIPPAPVGGPVECLPCDGRGVVENDDTDSLHTPMWATCTVCEGAGTVDPFLAVAADEPNVLDTVDPVWGLPAVERLRVLRERSRSGGAA
ncbi:hypothetical protein [Nocardioides sp. T2.26MG-1]|uniref:hypothetical protein n=1 Tax=Nocardioides sp. T2.26MG-1 TaxID=3041166 RepID=UPI0024773076|nr:hypothetical protein [Nocardioides sp. T2.26MG-1]CAI9417170.1 hypothetical protein HIDPHFAB_02953 [Nocardioides sp. T2.26MG-1]